MQTTRLTDRIVKAAHPPASGQSFIRDRELRGFALRITATGARSFIFETSTRGRSRRVTLGQFPVLNVPLARQKAIQLKAAIAAGDDPFAKPEGLKFSELATRYIEEHAKVAKVSWRRDERRLGLHFARWRSWQLADITAQEVAKVHQAVARERGQVEANRAVQLLRGMLNKARTWGLLEGRNPAEGVTLFREEHRERFLTPVEIQRLYAALADEPNIYWRTFFLASLTLGTRKGELLSARWSDIDFEQRIIKIPKTKNRRPHLLPLPAPIIEILDALPSRGASPWVFPGGGHTGHLVEPKPAWGRIRTRAGIEDCTIHDLRRSLGSLLAAQGFDILLIGKILNHKSPNATAIYARFGNAPVRAALDSAAAVIFGGAR